jgi:dTDP-4-amino-4,6-dideoxygalactose transaminase
MPPAGEMSPEIRRVRYNSPYVTPEMQAAVGQALLADAHVLGPNTKAFERAFAEFVGTDHAVAVSSGTAALHVGLLAAGIGPGDEVIVPANAYVPVADCVRLVGARPVLVDVDEATACLDPALVEASLTSRTRAVIPLHMYGHPVDLDPLLDLARARGLLVVEDAAHALGTRYRGRTVGSFGDFAIFSTGRKHLMTGGVGGMLATNRSDLAERALLLRNHGRSERQQRDARETDRIDLLGLNYRLSEALAALGPPQLQLLPTWNEARRASAARYRQRLAELALPVQPLQERDWAYHTYLHFPIRAPRRDQLAAFLAERGVETHFIYPVPVHHQKLHQGHVDVPPAGLPVSERLTSEVLVLTTRHDLTPDEIDYTCQQLAAFYQ